MQKRTSLLLLIPLLFLACQTFAPVPTTPAPAVPPLATSTDIPSVTPAPTETPTPSASPTL
ncbi:MAG: hypothetical protein HUU38_32580, partial [Anaerolineales bacterium]|nr:hypothetical protein [Anaerolineales bacterium]